EFYSPDDSINVTMSAAAQRLAEDSNIHFRVSGQAILRGPFFEGRKYDKAILRGYDGVESVGMSVLPEACITAVYEVPTLAVSYITNDDAEAHSHQENQRRAKADAPMLSKFLTELMQKLDRPAQAG